MKWIESFKTGALQNPPGSWAGGVLKDFVSYEYAPLFFRNVSEPRLRTKPADILWIIETTEKYQLASLEYAFAKILRLYLDILLTAEEVAGQITYHSYGLTNVNDDKYWEAREKAFEAVGLNLSGEEFLKKAIPRIEDLVKELMSE